MSPRSVPPRLAVVRTHAQLLLQHAPVILRPRVYPPWNLNDFSCWLTSLDGSALMHSVGTGVGHHAAALAITADEEVACACTARLLISASTGRGVESVARRIHDAGPRARYPFLHLRAGDFPVESQALREYCSSVLDRAAGGSLLIDAVEELPPPVQATLIDLLSGLELARSPSAAVRIISGTTVSLLDRIAAGTFLDRLFYRLNIIHLVDADGPSCVTDAEDAQ